MADLSKDRPPGPRRVSGGFDQRPGPRRGVTDEVREAVADAEECSDASDCTYGGRAIAVWIDRLRNRCSSGKSFKQTGGFRKDDLLVSADQASCSDLDRLRAIRSLAQYQDGFAKGRRLLLQPPGIRQYDARGFQDLDELAVGERIAGDDVVQADQGR